MLLASLTRPQLIELARCDQLPPSIRDQIHNELTLFAKQAPITLDVFAYRPFHVAKHPETFSSVIFHRKFMPNKRFCSGFKPRHVRLLLLRCLLLYWRIKASSALHSTRTENRT